MRIKKDLDWLLATRSWSLIRNRKRDFDGTVATINWKGRDICYRPGTSDPNIIYNVLYKKKPRVEYYVPVSVRPDVILDIGGHIGSAALYFSYLYPEAQVISFEPVEDNYQLLKTNTQSVANVKTVNVGLGKEDRLLTVQASTPENLASFSMNRQESVEGPTRKVEIRNTNECLRELGVEKIDIIKLDAEGAELEIICSLDPELLGGAQWITGELHGDDAFEVLHYLSQWYELGAEKKYSQRIFMFEGKSKTLA